MSEMPSSAVDTPHESRSLKRLRRLSRFMDSSIKMPGGLRIGWDGIIGLIPGIGDLAGTAVSAYIVLGAARLGASRALIVRMLLNVVLESLLGSVPVLGDLFDLFYKANDRNMRLLDAHAIDPSRAQRHSRLWLIALAIALVLFVLLLGWIILAIVGALLSLLLELIS